MGQTVNLLAYAFGGSNPSLPTWPFELCRGIMFTVKIRFASSLRVLTKKRFSMRAVPSRTCASLCGSSSVGRASAFQAEGRGFEPRLPLAIEPLFTARSRRQNFGIEPDRYIRTPPSRARMTCCCSSVVEHFLGKEEVVSSILINSSSNLIFSVFARPSVLRVQ